MVLLIWVLLAKNQALLTFAASHRTSPLFLLDGWAYLECPYHGGLQSLAQFKLKPWSYPFLVVD